VSTKFTTRCTTKPPQFSHTGHLCSSSDCHNNSDHFRKDIQLVVLCYGKAVCLWYRTL